MDRVIDVMNKYLTAPGVHNMESLQYIDNSERYDCS